MAHSLDDGWWVEADGERLSLDGYPSEFQFAGEPLPDGVVRHPLCRESRVLARIEVRPARGRAPREWLAFVLAHRTSPIYLCCASRLDGQVVSVSRMPGRIERADLAVFDAQSVSRESAN